MVLQRRPPPVTGLLFEEQAPVVASHPNRADVACFVGFVGRRTGPLPRQIQDWLVAEGWLAALWALPDQRLLIEDVLDVPIPIDSWDLFDALFAWNSRPLVDGQVGSTYLGAAVRSFFAQGGRRCYVVCVGAPWTPETERASRLAQIDRLIPGYPGSFAGSPADRWSWRGMAHLFGLPDVSFLCMPDLADAVSTYRQPVGPAEMPKPPAEQFVECADAAPLPAPDTASQLFAAPRCEDGDYADWARALYLAADTIGRLQREVQLVASVPMPAAGASAEQDMLKTLTGPGDGWLGALRSDGVPGLASAFLQLAYPWARTPGSVDLPEQLESPDAVLVGLLARNALTRGAFRSAANLPLGDVYDVHPSLRRAQTLTPHPDNAGAQAAWHTLQERVSLLGPTPSGLTLLSDVTATFEESYRPASVNRLVSVIVRTARRIGEALVFEPSGEQLWVELRSRLESLLLGLLQAGALSGATPADAFDVRCDRSTMSQNDLDNGRVVVEVQFAAAAPIEGITIALAIDAGGRLSLASSGQEAA